jgi:hypothetical protein
MYIACVITFLLLQQVVELVSSAISDFTESEFLGERDDLGRPVLNPDADVAFWRTKTSLAVGG